MTEPLDIDAVVRAIELPSFEVTNFALAIFVASIGFKFIKKFLLAGLTPLQRRRRVRRSLISRITHPSCSKFSGAALCRRQWRSK